MVTKKEISQLRNEKARTMGKRGKCPMCNTSVGIFFEPTIKCWKCGYIVRRDGGF